MLQRGWPWPHPPHCPGSQVRATPLPEVSLNISRRETHPHPPSPDIRRHTGNWQAPSSGRRASAWPAGQGSAWKRGGPGGYEHVTGASWDVLITAALSGFRS